MDWLRRDISEEQPDAGALTDSWDAVRGEQVGGGRRPQAMEVAVFRLGGCSVMTGLHERDISATPNSYWPEDRHETGRCLACHRRK